MYVREVCHVCQKGKAFIPERYYINNRKEILEYQKGNSWISESYYINITTVIYENQKDLSYISERYFMLRVTNSWVSNTECISEIIEKCENECSLSYQLCYYSNQENIWQHLIFCFIYESYGTLSMYLVKLIFMPTVHNVVFLISNSIQLLST